MDLGTIIAPQASRRVLKDIQRAQEPLMQEQGIWYHMDEANLTKGTAMIKGPPGTPYEGCLLTFSVQFPYDYPFSPPKVLFLTSDGRTRFHPNLYVEGKVCLSILGTFSGPSWSGTQSLSSVLLSILGLLDTNPLAHEPSYGSGTLANQRHKEYADFVEYQMIRLMITTMERFSRDELNHPWSVFRDIAHEQLPSLQYQIATKIKAKAAKEETTWASVVYGMGGHSQWKSLAATPWVQTCRDPA
jgi:ubiquitin-protein ligase